MIKLREKKSEREKRQKELKEKEKLIENRQKFFKELDDKVIPSLSVKTIKKMLSSMAKRYNLRGYSNMNRNQLLNYLSRNQLKFDVVHTTGRVSMVKNHQSSRTLDTDFVHKMKDFEKIKSKYILPKN